MMCYVGHRQAVTAVGDDTRFGDVQLLPVGHPELITTWEEFQRYDDQEISFVDLSSAVLARKHNVEHIVTLDSDFETLGFTLVPFERS